MGSKTLISILFLRDHQRDKYQEFVKKGWDIIITEGDGGFLIPQILLEFIAGEKNVIKIKSEDRTRYESNPNYKEIRKLLFESSIDI